MNTIGWDGHVKARLAMFHDVPGSELPSGIYRLAWIAFAWMVMAAWIGFGREGGTDLDLAFVTIVILVLTALPMLARKTALRHKSDFDPAPTCVDEAELETTSGKLPNGEVYVQVLLIPVALAIAATAFAVVYLVGS